MERESAMSNTIPKPSHPAPDRVRRNWLNLNGEWEFSFDEPSYDRHITVPFSWACPLSGIADERRGTGCYRRSVRYDAGGDRLFLVFGAVDYDAEVSVNGIPVGSHRGGYTRFEFDITEAWDSFSDNTIEVKATDNDERTHTYGKQGYGNARGIWQTVWLERRPAVYLSEFTIRTSIDGTVTVLYDTVGADPGAVALFCGKRFLGTDGKIEFQVENPRLWTPDDPYLYEGAIVLGEDRVETYFGIREVTCGRVDKNGYPLILLNGKPIFLSGVLDQSYNPTGFFTLPTDEDAEEEILRLKRIGINMARIHIKLEEPLKLSYADRHGLLIMADLPCFWGAPTEEAKCLFEEQMRDSVVRDINHPSLIYRVVFNESWGLLDKDKDGKQVFLPETQEWVRNCFHQVKALDPTRPVEDNSPCRHDHVETDVLTWHFYRNGYQQVKEEIERFCAGAVIGSSQEYIGDNRNGDVPAMNSECGNVWGMKGGNAGDSDLSWHYHYMMNEFRLHDRLCGFVFTQFHDVINEFNGYYRIDNNEKQFGYEAYVPGMTLSDLHGPLFLAAECPPMRRADCSGTAEVPLFLSCFDADYPGKILNVRWETVLTDRFGKESSVDSGTVVFRCRRIGLTSAGTLTVPMPSRPGTVTLRLLLTTPAGKVLMRNFVLFDLPCEDPSVLSIPVTSLSGEGFHRAWTLLGDGKFNGTGAGTASFKVSKSDIPCYRGGAISLRFEASTKEEMTKDRTDGKEADGAVDISYMLGYRVDRGANPNCFYMTDETLYPGTLTVSVEGREIDIFSLPDSPADSRGCLSHFYQPSDDRLEETGSYGYLCFAVIPETMAAALPETFTVSLKADHGLSVFGRKSGRYPVAIDVTGD